MDEEKSVQDLRQDDEALKAAIRERIQAHGGDPERIDLEPHGEDAVVAKVRLVGKETEEQGVFLRSALFPE